MLRYLVVLACSLQMSCAPHQEVVREQVKAEDLEMTAPDFGETQKKIPSTALIVRGSFASLRVMKATPVRKKPNSKAPLVGNLKPSEIVESLSVDETMAWRQIGPQKWVSGADLETEYK